MHKRLKSSTSRTSILVFAILCLFTFAGEFASARNDKGTVEPSELNFREGMRKMKMKDYAGAGDNFLQSIYFARNHYNPEGYLYYGLAMKAQRNYAKAIEALNQHLKQVTEKSPNARVDLAECYMAIKEFDKAREQIQLARGETSYDEKRPLFAQGELLEKLDDLGYAAEAYRAALGEKPWKYIEAWEGLARIYVKRGDYNDAIAEYKEIIASTLRNVNWVEVYYNYGQCLYKRGDHQGAIDHWLYALKEDPDAFDCHLALASIFDEEKHISSAIKEYENAVRCAPKEYDLTKVNQRMVYLQSKLQQQEARKEVKPTPYMRQQEEAANAPREPVKRAPADSGF